MVNQFKTIFSQRRFLVGRRSILGALIGIAFLAAACQVLISDPSSAEPGVEERVGEGLNPDTDFTPEDVGLEIHRGLPAGFTEEGYPFLGNPEAPLTLIEFSDFLCPFCGRHFDQTLPALLETYGRSGQLKYVFRDYPLIGLHPTAPQGHAAAHCAGEQSAVLFWEMHDRLFAAQSQWAGLADPTAFINGVAAESGVDMEAYADCLADGRTMARVNDSVTEGQLLGFNGTPTFRLITAGGEIAPIVGAQPLPVFAQTIESILGGDTTMAATGTGEDATVDPEAAIQVSFDTEGLDLETYKGLPVGFTEEGYPFIGNPEADITLVEFSDYLCPFCGRHFKTTLPALLQSYGAEGQVNFVFRDYPLTKLHPTAPVGHVAAICVGEQGAAAYWEMHDLLFDTQQQWGGLPDPRDFIDGLAGRLAIDQDAYQACMAAGENGSLVDERIAAGQALGFTGTPSFQVLVEGRDTIYPVNGAQPLPVFSDLFDTLLAGEEPEMAAEPDPAELPYWASAEGLVPDPDRPGFTLAGDPYKGNPEAAVVVVEFADFQCPACGQHALEIQPAIDQQLVDTGAIMWVFKSLPLAEHPQALPAAVAAECAGEQGSFWEMHHELFARIDDWAVDDADGRLLDLAGDVGLDKDAFSTCFNGRAALQRIVGDMYDAREVTDTTPAFVVLHGGRGRLLEGSRPADAFVQILESILAAENESG